MGLAFTTPLMSPARHNHTHTIMEQIVLKKQAIVVQLGGMQISRDELENCKARIKTNSDKVAIDYLVHLAETAFSRYIQTYC